MLHFSLTDTLEDEDVKNLVSKSFLTVDKGDSRVTIGYVLSHLAQINNHTRVMKTKQKLHAAPAPPPSQKSSPQ